MIAAVVLGLALMSSEDGLSRPQLLEAKAACRLIKGGKIPRGVVYSIPGEYGRGMHGASLWISGCDEGVPAEIDGEVATKISAFHSAFKEKCGVDLIGDHVSGVFTGKFIKRKSQIHGLPPIMMNYFVISDIETKGLDPASITCK
jgi:hypothetical protein